MKKLLLCLLSVFALASPSDGQNSISNYIVCIGRASFANRDFILLRKFKQQNKTKFLAVDVRSLNTSVLDSANVKFSLNNWQQLKSAYSNTPFIKALIEVEAKSFLIQDAGLTHGYPAEKGITLTIDLCPSHKPLDRSIFNSLINEFSVTETPVPLGLSISGRFLLNHEEDINWINRLQQENLIKVTWINHTYSHYYDPKVPLTENFLLKPGTNIHSEVLKLEQLLLNRGMLPSVFFRFPGLISDSAIVKQITTLGLIPIGSDAWLAKVNLAKNGSIVLIHGNGNEPIGVKDFINLIKNKSQLVKTRQWLMFDLSSSVKGEF
jgi:hypothetical protein